MRFFVYVIGTNSSIHKTYVGWTNNVKKRLEAHNSSRGAKSTRGHEWKLLYKEELSSKSEAMKREYELKRDRKLRSDLRKLIS